MSGITPENDEITAATNRLLAACTSLQRSDLIPYSLMEKEFCVARDTGNWKYLCTKFCRQFLKVRGIKLWAVPNVGYHLCTEVEQNIENALKRKARARNQTKREIHETEVSSFHTLSVHEQKARAMGLDAARRRKNEMAREMREVDREMRKSSVPPMMPPPIQMNNADAV